MRRAMGLGLWCAVMLAGGGAATADPQFVDITPTLVLPSMSGRDIYRYYCASCHGNGGRGDGPVASSLTVRPRDLTGLKRRNDGHFPRARVEAFIGHGPGGAPVRAHGSSEMPVWGPIFEALDPSDTIARQRIENVTRYLESIQR